VGDALGVDQTRPFERECGRVHAAEQARSGTEQDVYEVEPQLAEETGAEASPDDRRCLEVPGRKRCIRERHQRNIQILAKRPCDYPRGFVQTACTSVRTASCMLQARPRSIPSDGAVLLVALSDSAYR
jgi:hypothetical protein